MRKLGIDFYQRANVLQIAKELLGKNIGDKMGWHRNIWSHCGSGSI